MRYFTKTNVTGKSLGPDGIQRKLAENKARYIKAITGPTEAGNYHVVMDNWDDIIIPNSTVTYDGVFLNSKSAIKGWLLGVLGQNDRTQLSSDIVAGDFIEYDIGKAIDALVFTPETQVA